MSFKKISPHFLLVIAAAAAAMIVADIKGYFHDVIKPIATLTQTSGTVKRLPKDEFGWNQAPQGAQFAEGDAISVGEAGSATLEFSNGSTVELSEGSLMVISSRAEKVELSFASGRAKLRLIKAEQEKLFKISQSNTAQLTPGKPEQEPVVVEMVSPKAAPVAAPPPATPPKVVIKPKKSSLGGDGEIISRTLVPRAPTPKLPAADAVIYTNDKSHIDFAWEPSDSGTPAVRYELVLLSAEGKPTTYNLTAPLAKIAPLPDGKYTWSVRALDAQGNKSTVSTAQTVEIKTAAKTLAPKLLAPGALKASAVTVKRTAALPAPMPTAASAMKPVLMAPKPVLMKPKMVTNK